MNVPDRAEHNYTDISEPFVWGNRLVQMATEILEDHGFTVLSRKLLLDAETGKPLDTLDADTHVIHPDPDGTYRIAPVVDADPKEKE